MRGVDDLQYTRNRFGIPPVTGEVLQEAAQLRILSASHLCLIFSGGITNIKFNGSLGTLLGIVALAHISQYENLKPAQVGSRGERACSRNGYTGLSGVPRGASSMAACNSGMTRSTSSQSSDSPS